MIKTDVVTGIEKLGWKSVCVQCDRCGVIYNGGNGVNKLGPYRPVGYQKFETRQLREDARIIGWAGDMTSESVNDFCPDCNKLIRKKMMSKVLCLFHANCMDGFSAAWVVGKKFGFDNVEFVEAKYGSKLPNLTNRDVVIVDFSYKPAVLKPWFKSVNSLTMLDHHKSAYEDWEDELDNASTPSTVKIKFDQKRSGAGMAWHYYFPDMRRPRVIEHVQDYDLWLHSIPNTVELIAGMWASDKFKKRDFALIDDMLNPDKYLEMIKLGGVIEKTKNDLILSMIDTGNHRFVKVVPELFIPVMHLSSTLANHAGVYLNRVALQEFQNHLFTSQDLVELERAGGLFSATYTENWADKRRTFSLRSNKEYEFCMDVTTVSRLYGGGGHANSSGFSVPIQVPVHLLFSQGFFTRLYVKALVWFYTKINQNKKATNV